MIGLIFIKVLITVVIVVGLSVIAEHVGPRVAGLLSGYPLGAAIALFFYGLEISPEFASESSIYTMLGLISIACFAFIYYLSTLFFTRFPILMASCVSVIGFFCVSWLLHHLTLGKVGTVVVTVLAIVSFIYLFRKIPDERIENRIVFSFRVLVLRAFIAASFIVVITGTAKVVGSTWAGLFSAFPTTFFPLILIMHFTYDKKHVHTIIKHFPIGLGSLVVYSISVSFSYPALGIYIGTAVSFAAATLYLLIYQFFVCRFFQVKSIPK
ncbi:MAG: hypothetical protein ACP5G0_07340 [Desulfomonilia bacterium]